MKKIFILIIVGMLSICGFSQNQLKTYSPPPNTLIASDAAIPLEPATDSNFNPSNYNVGKNTNFKVKVSSVNTNPENWVELFGYNTFISAGNRQVRSKATFVSFDFSGTVYIEVTVNTEFIPVLNFSNGGNLIIRPQSKNIVPYYKNGHTFRFAISNPAKLSIEVNGLRDSNLQIFANPIDNYVPTGSNVKIYGNSTDTSKIYYLSSNPANPLSSNNKVYIKSGAVVIGDIEAKNGDEIYIEGGGILKGEIKINEKSYVKIHGNGIIDLSNYAKHYTVEGGDFYRRAGIKIFNSNNIVVKGVIVNDSQQTGILLKDSEYITVDNFKLLTRVIYGDGIHMKGTSNVTINDSYIRSSDDGIAIYASRRDQSNPSYPAESEYLNRPALNISVTNSSFYTDAAHPITIGWHGNYDNGNNGLDIYNMYFDNIDILEQDVIGDAYSGAMSINCSDGNKCDNIIFKNIRIEDFSNGRLLSVNVEPGCKLDSNGNPYDCTGAAITNGKSVSYVRFENIFYNGSGETPSPIQGIDCNRFVNGVHFENFNVNGNVIAKLSDYTINGNPGFKTNAYAYNITFQEGNIYGTGLPNGYYRIKTNSGIYTRAQSNVLTSSTLSSSDTWYVYRETSDSGVYKILNVNNGYYAEITDDQLNGSLPSCQQRYIKTLPIGVKSGQEWKIVGNNTTGYKIINAYKRAYLGYSGTITAGPATGTNSQLWKFDIVNISGRSPEREIMTEEKLTIFPNPVNEQLTVNTGSGTINKIVISDINGRTVIDRNYEAEQSIEIDMSGLEAGIYIATINSDTGEIVKKIIKQ